MNPTRKIYSHWVLVLLLACQNLFWPSAILAATTLSHQEWPRTRSGRIVMAIPAIRSIQEQFEKTPGSQIVIRYPGGDLGNAWAFDVRNWLVALGITSTNIVLEPGSGSADTLVLDVQKRPAL
ncbi:MAG TPA: hypothetical protein ENI62_01685 [Gammaproteobacteria bacterium]|nr:hypothetical protein [Gammaproteobacteria bacterium]